MTSLLRLVTILAMSLLALQAAAAQGFLKIPDIEGESMRAGHEGEIDIRRVSYAVTSADTSRLGSGRVRARASFDDVVVEKGVDAASPYLALAAAQGKRFRTVTISIRKDSGDAHLDYLTITLTNAVITGVDTDIETPGAGSETVSFAFDAIAIKYVEMEEDHSAGAEHEIAFDVAKGL